MNYKKFNLKVEKMPFIKCIHNIMEIRCSPCIYRFCRHKFLKNECPLCRDYFCEHNILKRYCYCYKKSKKSGV